MYTLAQKVIGFLLLDFVLLLALDREIVVLQGHRNVILGQAGEISFDDRIVLLDNNINTERSCDSGLVRGTACPESAGYLKNDHRGLRVVSAPAQRV